MFFFSNLQLENLIQHRKDYHINHIRYWKYQNKVQETWCLTQSQIQMEGEGDIFYGNIFVQKQFK